MNRPELSMVECPHCAGRGRAPGPDAGAVLRREREEHGVSRGQLLPFFEKPGGGTYSESYLIDLERGLRSWSQELVDRYRKAVERAVKKRLRELEKEAANALPG